MKARGSKEAERIRLGIELMCVSQSYNYIPSTLKWDRIWIKGPEVSFSACQRNLIKTFQIEGMIALITKMTAIFSSDLLNGQK